MKALLGWLAATAIAGFMVWVRLRASDEVFTGGRVWLVGSDAWYHARLIRQIARDWPRTPGFDPWTHFPYGSGRHSGFGGLYDQLVALAGLVVGRGAPDDDQLDRVTAYAPAVLGGLTALPVYGLGDLLAGPAGGLAAAATLALTGEGFLDRTMVGFADHHAAEACFGALAFYGIGLAVSASGVPGAALGGVLLAAYLMVWGAGLHVLVPLGGVVVVYAMVTQSAGFLLQVMTMTVVAAALTAVYAKEPTLAAKRFSAAQPLALIGVTAVAAALWALALVTPATAYPLAAAGLVVAVGAGGLWHPRTRVLVRSLVNRCYSFDVGGISVGYPGGATIVSELERADIGDIDDAIGGLWVIAVAGWLLLVGVAVRDTSALAAFVALLAPHALAMYLTMRRFEYYLAIVLAVLVGYGIAGWLVLLPSPWGAVLTGGVILGAAIEIAWDRPGGLGGRRPVWEQAANFGGVHPAWRDACEWLRTHTPGVSVDLLPVYDADGFDYPDEAYGILSTWDAGHWILEWARRPVLANPFQEGKGDAAAFLLAQTPERADLVRRAIGNRSGLTELPTSEVREAAEGNEAPSLRYVMIDDEMAGEKFGGLVLCTSADVSIYTAGETYRVGADADEWATLPGRSWWYRRTMLSRLYHRDCDGLERYRLVYEHPHASTFASVAKRDEDGDWVGDAIHQRIDDDTYDGVTEASDRAFYDVRQASVLKVFEAVEGAVIRGEAPVAGAVTVRLTLETDAGRQFTYTQGAETDESGAFAVRVPYPTLQGVEPARGGTAAAVSARGAYEVLVGHPVAPDARATVGVSDRAVYDGSAVEVTSWT